MAALFVGGVQAIALVWWPDEARSMRWIEGRRRGWIPRKPKPPPAPLPAPAKTSLAPVAPVQPVPLMVPLFPCFSQAAVAHVVGKHRATVQYWLASGKLGFYRDNIGERYVLRAELIRFIREYLQRQVVENPDNGRPL